MYELPPLPTKKKPRPPYRKPDAVKHLEQLLFEDDLRRHPSIKREYIARRKHRDDTANGLTACIVAYAKLNGAFASRLNNTGIYRNGKFTRSTARRGLPDVLVTLKGQSIFIEVKAKRDKMSQYQEAVRDDQTQAGGLYYVAHNFTDFKAWFDAFAVGVVPQKNI
jgi:hypothetical protein